MRRITTVLLVLTAAGLSAQTSTTTPAPADPEALKSFKLKCLASQAAGIARKDSLEAFEHGNPWVKTFFADHTFEVDFIKSGNAAQVVATIPDVYTDPATITQAKNDIESGDIARYGKRVLRMAAQEGKGWFAILLSKQIHHQTVIPDYILDAIFFSYPSVSNEVWGNILNYRLRCIQGTAAIPSPEIVEFRTKLRAFKSGTMAFEEIRNAMLATFAADKHRLQRRKDAEASPYINHPLALADILAREGGVEDAKVIAAALLPLRSSARALK